MNHFALLLLFIFSFTSNSTPSASPFLFEDPTPPTCNEKQITSANDGQLFQVLHDLTRQKYFSSFEVDLTRECMFWKRVGSSEEDIEEEEFVCGGSPDPATSTTTSTTTSTSTLTKRFASISVGKPTHGHVVGVLQQPRH